MTDESANNSVTVNYIKRNYVGQTYMNDVVFEEKYHQMNSKVLDKIKNKAYSMIVQEVIKSGSPQSPIFNWSEKPDPEDVGKFVTLKTVTRVKRIDDVSFEEFKEIAKKIRIIEVFIYIYGTQIKTRSDFDLMIEPLTRAALEGLNVAGNSNSMSPKEKAMKAIEELTEFVNSLNLDGGNSSLPYITQMKAVFANRYK